MDKAVRMGLIFGGVGLGAGVAYLALREKPPQPEEIEESQGLRVPKMPAGIITPPRILISPQAIEALQTGPTEPDSAYVFQLLKYAARSKGSEGKAARQKALTEGQISLDIGEPQKIWSLLWRLTRQGLYGNGSDVGMKQSQRDDEINAIVTNLIAYELFWRKSTGESFADNDQDRVRNLFHRYQYIVSRILAPKVRAKYGQRQMNLIMEHECKLTEWRGPSWGKFILPLGLIVKGNYSVKNCDAERFMLALSYELTYAIGRLAILSINAAEYVGYNFDSLMAGVTMVGAAFTESF